MHGQLAGKGEVGAWRKFKQSKIRSTLEESEEFVKVSPSQSIYGACKMLFEHKVVYQRQHISHSNSYFSLPENFSIGNINRRAMQ